MKEDLNANIPEGDGTENTVEPERTEKTDVEVSEEKLPEDIDAEEDELDRKLEIKKSKYICIGMVIGCILACIASVIVILYENKRYTKMFQELATANSLSGETETNVTAIEQKLEVIEKAIGNTFLFDIDYSSMAEDIYKAAVESLGDKYSTYYTAEEYKAMQESTTGTFYGLGAAVSKVEDTGFIELLTVYEDSGAEDAGLVAGDMITAIDGTEVADIELSEAVTLMRGEEGTTVEVTIYRPSTNETKTYTVTRKKVVTTSAAGTMLENTGDHKIGYIVISQFESETASQFKNALKELEDEGAEGVIVDIRSNPGGLLNTAVSICDELLPEGLVVYTEDKNGNKQEYKSDAEADTIPMVLLINENSASASEIFAGAMQDYGRAKLVGTQSFGKGIVQTIKALGDGSALKLTVAKYYTPNGRCIHGTGITPDVEVELDTSVLNEKDEADFTWEDDTQVKAGYEELIKELEAQ